MLRKELGRRALLLVKVFQVLRRPLEKDVERRGLPLPGAAPPAPREPFLLLLGLAPAVRGPDR